MKCAGWTLILVLACTSSARAQDWPLIRAIGFYGNEVTRPVVMLREILVREGDPAVPEKIERSRQALLDLGLFKSVSVTQTKLDDGVRLTFTVDEKWYILPVPRYSVNSEGENAYGLALRWSNFAGLNHNLRASWSSRDEKQFGQDRVASYNFSYRMPFVLDSPYNLGLGLSHRETPVTDPVVYKEVINGAFIGLSRTFPTVSASQGWTLGGSLAWSNQQTQGENAPPAYGMATEFGLFANFRDVRFRVYSEEGVSYGASIGSAIRDAGSDYSFNVIKLGGARFMALGDTPHQSLHLFGAAGSYHGGPVQPTLSEGAFDLGGASHLRGYPPDFLVGDAFYLLTAEYLRPVYWKSLRLLLVAEAGNVFPDASEASLGRVYTSVGIGLRWRVTFLVNVEIEAGVAWPVSTDGGARIFAGGV